MASNESIHCSARMFAQQKKKLQKNITFNFCTREKNYQDIKSLGEISALAPRNEE